MFLLLILWYCIDDHVAAYSNTPWLGTIPWYMIVVPAIMLSIVFRPTVVVRNN